MTAGTFRIGTPLFGPIIDLGGGQLVPLMLLMQIGDSAGAEAEAEPEAGSDEDDDDDDENVDLQ
jgi:hypothetical protein